MIGTLLVCIDTVQPPSFPLNEKMTGNIQEGWWSNAKDQIFKKTWNFIKMFTKHITVTL